MKNSDLSLSFKRPDGKETICIFDWDKDKEPILSFLTKIYKSCNELEETITKRKPEQTQAGNYEMKIEGSKGIFGAEKDVHFYTTAKESSSLSLVLRILLNHTLTDIVGKIYQQQNPRKG